MKRYGGITPRELELLRSELTQNGIEAPAGDNVELRGPHGVVLQAKYEPARQTLTISILKKPIWLPANRIWEIVDQSIEHFSE